MKTEFFRADASRFDNLAAKPFWSAAAVSVGFINAVVKRGEVDRTASLLVCGAFGNLKQLHPEVITVEIMKHKRTMFIFVGYSGNIVTLRSYELKLMSRVT